MTTEEKKCSMRWLDDEGKEIDRMISKAKVLEIIDKAMKFNQKTKDAYLKYGKPMKKADYEMIIWTEIRKRISEELK